MRTLVLALTAAVALTPAATAADKVELKEASVADLTKAVAAHKGQVVMIDCWYLGCAPCKKKFPYMVAVHKKLAGDGLVFMSLDLLPDDLKEKDKVLDFLTKQEAAFPNFIFSDKQDAIDKWQEKHEAEAAPAIVAFNRKGEWLKVPEAVSKEKDPQKYADKLAEWAKTLLAEK
jgi:thiol-disulfide isomerase/thioredoxin